MPNYSGIWTRTQQMQAIAAGTWTFPPPTGQDAYTSSGTYSWIAPTGCVSISVVCVGPGGPYAYFAPQLCGGGGGALAYVNNFSVTPGNSYTVVVGANSEGSQGTASSFNATTCKAGAGVMAINSSSGGVGGAVINGTGGAGGNGSAGNASFAAGGGAGGYSGSGGNSGNSGSPSATAGSGGGGGGAYFGVNGGGGGVGILGQGSNGAAGDVSNPGYGGSGGANGSGNVGGNYGGGAGAGSQGKGAVRIIYPGTTRLFPSTNTGDL